VGPSLAELSTLDDNDSAIRGQLQQLTTDPEWLHWLQGENLIQRMVGFVDALARGVVARKLLPITPPGDFVATRADGKIWLDHDSYRRFDRFVTLVNSIDTQLAARLFHWLRPLLEASYGELGYAPEDFDRGVIAAIEHCLAAPEIATPIALTLTAKVYRFEDPALEALPAVQKQLLRMGPDNVHAIKQQLRLLRDALLELTLPADAAESADSPSGE
jgi:hypothetical protein